MNWNIICDSSIDLFRPEHDAHNIRFATVPFTLTVGNTSFVDDENLDKPTLLRELKDYSGASTSACPSTGAWLDEFEKGGNVIALTITSGLSGSSGRRNSAYSSPPTELIALGCTQAGRSPCTVCTAGWYPRSHPESI